MDKKAMIERLRILADKLEREESETIRYLGEDGAIHEIPLGVRVTHIPKVANQSYLSLHKYG